MVVVLTILPNLVMTNSSPWKPWPTEIDGLPSYIAWWIFPWRTANVITRWYIELLQRWHGSMACLSAAQSAPHTKKRVIPGQQETAQGRQSCQRISRLKSNETADSLVVTCCHWFSDQISAICFRSDWWIFFRQQLRVLTLILNQSSNGTESAKSSVPWTKGRPFQTG